MGQLIYSKDNYYITKDESYYTVIKNIGLKKNNPHTHLHSFKEAKLVLIWARKGIIPNKYGYRIQESIRRLIDTTE